MATLTDRQHMHEHFMSVTPSGHRTFCAEATRCTIFHTRSLCFNGLRATFTSISFDAAVSCFVARRLHNYVYSCLSVEAYKVVELIKLNLRLLIKLHLSKVGAAYVRRANNSVI